MLLWPLWTGCFIINVVEPETESVVPPVVVPPGATETGRPTGTPGPTGTTGMTADTVDTGGGPDQDDIVVVIDTSCSMQAHQSAVASDMSGFLLSLQGHDVHLGVITADTVSVAQAGLLRPAQGVPFVDDQTASPVELFTQMLFQGTGGASLQAGLEAARLLLIDRSQEPANQGFRRDGADLHLVFVSDGDDDSSELGALELADYIAAFDGLAGSVHAHALVDTDPASADFGSRYLAVVSEFEGQSADIEDRDLAALLEQVAVEVVAE